MFASKKGQIEFVSILLEAGADIEKINEEGETALSRATKHGHLECLMLLLHDVEISRGSENRLNMTSLTSAVTVTSANATVPYLSIAVPVSIPTTTTTSTVLVDDSDMSDELIQNCLFPGFKRRMIRSLLTHHSQDLLSTLNTTTATTTSSTRNTLVTTTNGSICCIKPTPSPATSTAVAAGSGSVSVSAETASIGISNHHRMLNYDSYHYHQVTPGSALMGLFKNFNNTNENNDNTNYLSFRVAMDQLLSARERIMITMIPELDTD
eukprot:gene9828-20441_t